MPLSGADNSSQHCKSLCCGNEKCDAYTYASQSSAPYTGQCWLKSCATPGHCPALSMSCTAGWECTRFVERESVVWCCVPDLCAVSHTILWVCSRAVARWMATNVKGIWSHIWTPPVATCQVGVCSAKLSRLPVTSYQLAGVCFERLVLRAHSIMQLSRSCSTIVLLRHVRVDYTALLR